MDLTKGLASRPVDQTRRPKGTAIATEASGQPAGRKQQTASRGRERTLALALNLHPSVSDSVDLRVGSDNDLLSGKRVHGVPSKVLLERQQDSGRNVVEGDGGHLGELGVVLLHVGRDEVVELGSELDTLQRLNNSARQQRDRGMRGTARRTVGPPPTIRKETSSRFSFSLTKGSEARSKQSRILEREDDNQFRALDIPDETD